MCEVGLRRSFQCRIGAGAGKHRRLHAAEAAVVVASVARIQAAGATEGGGLRRV